MAGWVGLWVLEYRLWQHSYSVSWVRVLACTSRDELCKLIFDMTASEFRKIALSFPEAIESSHMSHPDFRVGGKIFATLGYPNDEYGMVVLMPEDQKLFVKVHGDAFAPAKGAWGQAGSTLVQLKRARSAAVREALSAAWRRRAPKRLLQPDV